MPSESVKSEPIHLPLDDFPSREAERAILRRFLHEAGLEELASDLKFEMGIVTPPKTPYAVRRKDWERYWALMERVLTVLPQTMAEAQELAHFIRCQRSDHRSPCGPPPLLSVAQMAASCGSQAPHTLYQVLDSPSLLFGAPFPQKDFVWPESKVPLPRAVVCVSEDEVPEYECDEFRADEFLSWNLQGFFEPAPRSPLTMFQQLDEVVDAVWRLLVVGMDVLVHCTDGHDRTSLVIGGVLVRMGHRPEDVVRYLDDLTKQRGQLGWPERTWHGEMLRMLVSGRPADGAWMPP
jgi:hypothetical protein